MKIIRWVKRLWRSDGEATPPAEPRLPAAPNGLPKSLVMGLAHTQAEELSCDEVYALLDVFAEMVSRGEDAAALMPLVQHHLEMCPDCHEELTALLRSMEAVAA